ncbi:MAG: hypothetical protein KDK12_00200 [Rhodobacteraceae bacterium]|nr:hypothetical protein [Paracoccaceae bacterium]
MKPPRLATCDQALPTGLAASGAPEWVHLMPAGRVVARDGRSFELVDPAAVILDFEARAVDLPIDYEHRMDNPDARLKGPVPAAGWIKALAHDETGIWGRVEWTATARDMIARKEYRYLSPAFTFNKARPVLRLWGAGLVHHPALHLKALAQEETAVTPDPEKRPARAPKPVPGAGDCRARPAQSSADWAGLIAHLLQVLHLPEDATEDGALDALERLLTQQGLASQRPDPARFVPIEAVRELMDDRNARLATMRESEAQARVSEALRVGRITPAMRDWATALCMSDPASFDAFVSRSPGRFAHLHQRATFPALPSGTAPAATSEAAQAVCAQLGLTPERLSRA